MDKDVVYIHNGILLSHEKNEIKPCETTWMGLEIIIRSEVSQEEKKKVSHDITYMLNLKYDTGTSLGVQGLRLPGSTAGAMGSIPVQVTEILHGKFRSKKKKTKMNLPTK